jgi:hypothetical protein
MLKLKTKWFNKWSKKNSIKDDTLIKTITSMTDNLGSVNLGSGLHKVRISRDLEGKSGGFRSIVVLKQNELAIFVYGFAKNEKDNLDKDELKYFKKLAKDLLKIEIKKYKNLMQSGEFIRIEE